jgi:hypothetical protein
VALIAVALIAVLLLILRNKDKNAVSREEPM